MTYLPLLLPFGLLMVVGGINVSESARAAGDDYRTRDILLVEAVATLVAGVCGGVAQTTPYIGQPAYKHGARSGYAADRPVRRHRRHARHHLRAGAVAAAGGAGTDHRVRGHRHHHPGLPGHAAPPYRRDGVRFPAFGGLPAGDQGTRLDRTGSAAPAADQARRPRPAGAGGDLHPGQWLHHHLDAVDFGGGGDGRWPPAPCLRLPAGGGGTDPVRADPLGGSRGGIYLPWELEGLARIISVQFAGAYVAWRCCWACCRCRSSR